MMRLEQQDGPDRDRKCTKSPDYCPRGDCSEACLFVSLGLAFLSERNRVIGERFSGEVELWLRRHSEVDADVVSKVADVENADLVLAEAAGRVEVDLATTTLERPDDDGLDPGAAA